MFRSFEQLRGCHGREAGRGERERGERFRGRFEQQCGEGGRERGGRFGRGEGFGRGGGPFGHGGPFGRGGAMRMFAAGDLRFVILKLLAEKPSHGYELIKAVGERLGGSYAPSPGVIYPMLTMLEELGQATVTAEGARKLYAITEAGQQALAENAKTVEAIFARMEQARTEQTAGPAQQIERAMMNLRMALRMKQGPLTTEQIHAITDILDAAAKQIERG